MKTQSKMDVICMGCCFFLTERTEQVYTSLTKISGNRKCRAVSYPMLIVFKTAIDLWACHLFIPFSSFAYTYITLIDASFISQRVHKTVINWQKKETSALEGFTFNKFTHIIIIFPKQRTKTLKKTASAGPAEREDGPPLQIHKSYTLCLSTWNPHLKICDLPQACSGQAENIFWNDKPSHL